MLLGIDFLNEVADRLGMPQIDTLEKPENQYLAEHRKLLRLLNRVLATTGGYNDWHMLRETADIVLVAAVETDGDSAEYVTISQDSTAMTVDGQAFDKSFIGRAIQVSGDEYIYRITEVTSPTELTLHRAWVNDSLVGATDTKTCTIAMDQYVLPQDYLRPVDDWQSFFAPYSIKPLTPNKFGERRRDRRDIRLSEPEAYTLAGTKSTRQVIHFDPYPENARMLSFEYQKNHPTINSDQDQILFPIDYIEALMDAVQYLAERDYKESPKMTQVLQDALRDHNLQQANAGPTESVPIIEPSGDVRASVRLAYGLPATPIDWGDAWDTGAVHGL